MVSIIRATEQDADSFENIIKALPDNEANAMIKKEFKILNHETGISVVAALKSLFSIHKATAQTPKKVMIKTMFEAGIFFQVCFPNKNRT